MSIHRVMLASNEKLDLAKLTYPLYGSPKFDGIRAYVHNGQLYSRKNILIPNKHTQNTFGKRALTGFDGELILQDKAKSLDCFRATTSAVMSEGGTPNVIFHVFDICNVQVPFSQRYAAYRSKVRDLQALRVSAVVQTLIKDELQLLYYEELALKAGYEGIILRSLNSPYKQGRSTLREGYLLKLKRFEDAEAEIIGFEELQYNDNELTVSATGAAKRSSHKAGKRAGGVLGNFILRMKDFRGSEITFSCGSGLTTKEKTEFWERRPELLGKFVKFKFQPVGVKDKPRSPVFLGFRDPMD